MGVCPSSSHAEETSGPGWNQRWSSDGDKTRLRKVCEESQYKISPTNGGTKQQTGHGACKDSEFSNWAGTVENCPAKVFNPRSVEEVVDIIRKAGDMSPPPRVRCVGSGHSWSPLFGDDGSWLIDTSGLKTISWAAEPNPTQITIGPGVTSGELATFLDSKERGKWRGLFLPADVVLESVTYGGTINSACHGTGKTQTLPDCVLATSIVTWNGEHVHLRRSDDPEGFAIKIASFGLLGVTTAFTLQLDPQVTAIKVTDTKMRAQELFLKAGELPKPGGPNPLLDAYEKNYAVEIFYFPASSLEVTDLFSGEFEDQKWDTSKDIVSIKAFQRTNNPVKRDNDKWLGIDPKDSTRFDHNFSITDWIEINLGTEVGLPLVSKLGDNPLIVSMYSKAAARAFEPFGQETGTVSYETSLAQAIHWQKYITDGFPVSDVEVCIKCDDDFTSAYKAIHAAISITKSFAEDEGTLPLNVALEMRFTKHSDSPLSPGYGKEGDVFIWIEVLSAMGTPRLKEYNTRVADAWLAITLKDGSQAARPHWAKWSEAFMGDADAKLKKAYADRLPLLERVAKDCDPNGMFMSDYFAKLFDTTTA